VELERIKEEECTEVHKCIQEVVEEEFIKEVHLQTCQECTEEEVINNQECMEVGEEEFINNQECMEVEELLLQQDEEEEDVGNFIFCVKWL
jgi:hypothetical protein